MRSFKKIWLVLGGLALLLGFAALVLYIDRNIRSVEEPRLPAFRTLTGHKGTVKRLAFSPDGRSLVSCSPDSVRVWEVETGSTFWSYSPDHGYFSVAAFSPDGQVLAGAGSDGTIKEWNVSTWKLQREFQAPEGVISLAYSPDGKLLASGESAMKASIRFWDTATGKVCADFQPHDWFLHMVAFSPDGKLFVSAGGDGKLIVWSLPSMKQKVFQRHSASGSAGIVCIAFTKDGTTFATGGVDGRIILWVAETMTEKAVLVADKGGAESLSLAFSPDGKILVCGSSDHQNKWAGRIKLWDMETNKEIGSFAAHDRSINCVAFSPDGKLLATGSQDDTVKFWKIADLMNAAAPSGKKE